jgi:hypothetical protein
MRGTFSFTTTLLFASILIIAPGAQAQKKGQNVIVQYGTVIQKEKVNLNSGAVPRGAVVGGALGLASAGGKSNKKKARNALVGAAGGAIASNSQGSTQGMLYTIDLGSAGMAQVVTDQTEIVRGDCVAVEKAGETANVRRISSGYCQPDNAAAVAAVAEDSAEDADECLQAKQMVVDATTSQEFEFAKAKMSLLCDD